MSAYVCNDETFAALASYAALSVNGDEGFAHWGQYSRFPSLGAQNWHRLSNEARIELVANILKAENIRSVNARYLESETAVACMIPANRFALPRDAVTILKLCDCLEYQSCDTDDYAETEAARLLMAIRNLAIRRLPGYDDAPWGLPDPRKETA